MYYFSLTTKLLRHLHFKSLIEILKYDKGQVRQQTTNETIMLDYLALQGSSENPTFVTIIFTVLLAFSLSSLIAWTFDRTTEMVLVPVAYLQSLVLVSIVAATVMQAIGDSLARGRVYSN